MSNSSNGTSQLTTAPVNNRKRQRFSRIRQACQRCRVRKQKCDLVEPKCSNCLKGDAECVMDTSHIRQAGESSRSTRTSEDFAEEASNGETDIHAETRPTQLSPPSIHSAALFNHGHLSPDLLPQLTHSHLRYAHPRSHDTAGSQGLVRVQELPTTTSANFWLNNGSPQSSTPRLPRPARKTPLPLLPELQRLINVYFSNRWPNHPIFYRSQFRTEVIDPVLRGENNNVAHYFLYMVLAVASIDAPGEGRTEAIDYYITATTFYLEATLAADVMSTIQALLLLTAFALSDPRSVSLWHVTGMTMRMCIDHRLHQLPSTALSETDGVLVELKRRVFWCAFALDRSVSISLGQPLAISIEQISTELPLMIDDPATMPSTNVLPDIAAFIHTIRLRAFNGEVHTRLQSPTVRPVFSEFLQRTTMTSDELETWRGGMRAHLEAWLLNAPVFPSPVTSTFKSKDWFMIAKSYSLLLLYRPSARYPDSPLPVMQICADASLSLIAAYFRLYTFSKVTYTWVALHSLFLATITAIFALQQSAALRASTSYETVQTNLQACSKLLGAMATQWPAARQCQMLAESLTVQTLALFEQDATTAREASLAAMALDHTPPSATTAMVGANHQQQATAPTWTTSPSDHFPNLGADLEAWLHLADDTSVMNDDLPQGISDQHSFPFDLSAPSHGLSENVQNKPLFDISGFLTPSMSGDALAPLSAADLDLLLNALP